MKFGLSTLLLAITVVSLIVLILVQRKAHEDKLVKLENAFETNLSHLIDVTEMESKARFAITTNRWSRENDDAYELCVENEMVILMVELFKSADKINQSTILVEKYGSSPAETIAGGLLNELDCSEIEFFARYADNRKLILRGDDFQSFVKSASSCSAIWKDR